VVAAAGQQGKGRGKGKGGPPRAGGTAKKSAQRISERSWAYALNANTEGDYNTATGYWALYANTTGGHNTAIGYFALRYNTTGTYNTALGDRALYWNTSGMYNTATGYQSLYFSTGQRNTAVGYQALRANTTGHSNTAIGYQAGDNITTGDYNIMIGYNTDIPTAPSSYRLNIGNTIYGNLSTDRVGIATGTSSGLSYTLVVAGDVSTTVGGYRDGSSCVAGTCASDARLKKDIHYLSNSLDTIAALRPARFQWRKEAYPDQKMPAKPRKDTGLIAQDVEKVLPHLVKTGDKGFKKVVYGLELQMHTIQAVKELKAKNDTLAAKNDILMVKNRILAAKVAKIANTLDAETRSMRAALQTMEKKLALLERKSTQRHASNHTPLTAGAVTGASSGGIGGGGVSGLPQALPPWSLHTLTLALLAAAFFFWRKKTAAQGA